MKNFVRVGTCMRRPDDAQSADFSELMMELHSSEASRYTALEVPLFACISMGTKEILDLLGG
jgi:chlorite dismutase